MEKRLEGRKGNGRSRIVWEQILEGKVQIRGGKKSETIQCVWHRKLEYMNIEY